MAVKLGDLLLKQKLITQDQLETALKLQREEGGKIGEALVRVGAVSEGDITETLSQQFGVPSIDLAHFEIDPAIIKVVPGEVARKYGVLPVNKTGATLTIAMGDPTNVFAMDDIKFMTGYNVEPVVASEIALRKAIDKHYGTPRSIVLKERSKQAGAGFAPESSLDDVMASSALTMDDMASVGLGELNMDEITGLDAGADVDVVIGDEGQEIDLSDLGSPPSRRPSSRCRT
jgi:type IV pilus assembly protein PilB